MEGSFEISFLLCPIPKKPLFLLVLSWSETELDRRRPKKPEPEVLVVDCRGELLLEEKMLFFLVGEVLEWRSALLRPGEESSLLLDLKRGIEGRWFEGFVAVGGALHMKSTL